MPTPSFPHLYLFKPVCEKTVARKRRRGLCVSWGCERPSEPGKSRCPTCRSRLYRLRNEAHYAYGNLRASARKRGIGFELTFDEFQAFCDRTGYLERRGKKDESLSVDREKTWLPYRADNIRVLTYLANVSHAHESANEPAEF